MGLSTGLRGSDKGPRRPAFCAIAAGAWDPKKNVPNGETGGRGGFEFEKGGRELKVRVEGQLVFNNIALRVNAALAGLGLAYLPEDQVQTHLADGRLIRVLADWCPPFPGYHLYYPSRRQPTPAFALLVDALRYRGPASAQAAAQACRA
jgi:DNA-binding transcriptional LysR family regulator